MDHVLGDVPTDEESKGHRADAPAAMVLGLVFSWQVPANAPDLHFRRMAVVKMFPAAGPRESHLPMAFAVAVKKTIRVR